MADEEQDRTEPATPYKREEARRRGQVAKSLEVNSLLIVAAALVASSVWSWQLIIAGKRGAQHLLAASATVPITLPGLHLWMSGVAWQVFSALIPFLLLLAAAGVLANVAQTGPVFSSHPLKPDIQRLNPVQGFKRLWSPRSLYEACKSLLKLALFSAVAYEAIRGMLPQILALTGEQPRHYPDRVLDFGRSLGFRLMLAMLLIAFIDVAFVRWEYARRMRMSRREQREEVKRREGDPHVRGKRRELQREAAKRSGALRRVPDADVLITNPTHLAVALKYQRGRSPAPRCIAKGAGEVALRMRRIANRRGVTVLERRSLARALFDEVAIDGLVPESLYEPVARVYADIAAAKDARRSTLEVRT